MTGGQKSESGSDFWLASGFPTEFLYGKLPVNLDNLPYSLFFHYSLPPAFLFLSFFSSLLLFSPPSFLSSLIHFFSFLPFLFPFLFSLFLPSSLSFLLLSHPFFLFFPLSPRLGGNGTRERDVLLWTCWKWGSHNCDWLWQLWSSSVEEPTTSPNFIASREMGPSILQISQLEYLDWNFTL